MHFGLLKGTSYMCHKYNALPAVMPIAGAAVDSEDLVLESADGTKFAAFLARSGEADKEYAGPVGHRVTVRPRAAASS